MPKVLTEAAVAQYGRDGYCAPFGLLEPEEAAAMRARWSGWRRNAEGLARTPFASRATCSCAG